MADGKVEFDLVAKADQAIRELRGLGEETGKLSDSFTTLAGTAKRRLLELGADSAIALGQQFGRDVLQAAQDVGRLESTIEQSFGANADVMRDWAEESKGLFGEATDQIVADMGDVANKLDLDGQDPSQLGMLQAIGEMAGIFTLYYPEFQSTEDTLEQITNYLATGEGGQLEDQFGDLGGAALEASERVDLLREKGELAYTAHADGALEAAERINELKAVYQEFVIEVGGLVADVAGPIMDFVGMLKDVDEGLRDVAGAQTEANDRIGEGLPVLETMYAAWDRSIGQWIAWGNEAINQSDKAGSAILDVALTMENADLDGTVNLDSSSVQTALDRANGLFTALGRLATMGKAIPSDGYAPNDPRGNAPLEFESVGPPLQNWDPDFSSGTRINMTIQVAPTTDASEVGRRTVEAIQAYERAAGTGWRG